MTWNRLPARLGVGGREKGKGEKEDYIIMYFVSKMYLNAHTKDFLKIQAENYILNVKNNSFLKRDVSTPLEKKENKRLWLVKTLNMGTTFYCKYYYTVI